MKAINRTWVITLTAIVIAGCTNDQAADEEITLETSALNGTIIPQGGPLTRLTRNYTEPNEATREADTAHYYATVRTDPRGVSGPFINTSIPNLQAFRSVYHFGTSGVNEVITYYYNRGDLGIGREMHCVDTTLTPFQDGQVACYVKNFAAGDAGTEFTFGLSSSIAFSNQHANNPFATVAMVFRGQMAATDPNRVFFVVYAGAAVDVNASLANFAALDRHAISFKNGTIMGTPAINFNLHIPSNCVSCHGGQQYASGFFDIQNGALFLPFDLDQFEYENSPGRLRSDQLVSFKKQNQMVRKVAALSTGGTSVVNQLDLWYHNTVFQTAQTEVFENDFDSNVVPSGWAGFEVVYRSVVRRSCRTCHIANQFGRTFETEAAFRPLAAISVSDICSLQMPHSLQSAREFWQSTGPADLQAYLRGAGHSTDADTLQNCSPGSVVTLDPPQLMAALAPPTL